jgi:hypothetical protein
MLFKQSTAKNVMLKAYDSADHVAPATGKTLTVTLSKDGGAFAAAGGSVTEISAGWYKVALNTTDTNTLGDLVIRATASGTDDIERIAQVVAVDLADAAGLGLSRLDQTIGSRMATFTYTAPDAAATVASAVWAAGTRTLSAFGFSVTADTVSDKTGYSLATAPPTAAQIRTEMDSSSTGIAAIKAVTDTLSLNGIADAILKRDFSAVTGEAARSCLNALRALRNKVSRSGATLTVTKEDDSTEAWTATIATSASAEAITEVDPA